MNFSFDVELENTEKSVLQNLAKIRSVIENSELCYYNKSRIS